MSRKALTPVSEGNKSGFEKYFEIDNLHFQWKLETCSVINFYKMVFLSLRQKA